MTDYIVKKERDTYTAYKNGLVVAKGCMSKRDALTAIWVLNGSKPSHFYEVVDDIGTVVLLVEEEEEL